jgi:hypothetical protein
MNNQIIDWQTNVEPDTSKDYNFWIEENEDFNDFTLSVYTRIASELQDSVHFFI